MSSKKLIQFVANKLLGIGTETGFFTPYSFMKTRPKVIPEYREFQACFTHYLDNMKAFLDTVGDQDSFFRESLKPNAKVDWDSDWLTALDCAATYSAVPHFKPKRIVEIGSGNTTHFMALAIQDHNLTTDFTCIDPSPRRSIEALNVRFERRVLSSEDTRITDQLEANDVLFVDSSHLLQEGFDVDIIFNRIVPRLNKGVVLHVHDIFLPDGYPKGWQSRHYNEQNILGGWVLSGAFEPIFASHFVNSRHPAMLNSISKSIPAVANSGGGSIWLQKTTAPFRA